MIMAQKFGIKLLCLYSVFCTNLVYANVIMTGTRVIFPAEKKEKTLQFSNNSDLPFLVQVWLDQGNNRSTPETSDAPFMVNPQVFRLNPHTGQTARLFYIGDGQLPKDRESIFYLNFKQIPAMDQITMEENKLVLLVKNRLKVFYRPKTITEKVENLPEQLNFKLQQDQTGSWLQITNPTGYYANLTQATLQVDEQKINIKDITMIAPKSSEKWQLKQPIPTQAAIQLQITLVNDYGAFHQYNIRPQP